MWQMKFPKIDKRRIEFAATALLILVFVYALFASIFKARPRRQVQLQKNQKSFTVSGKAQNFASMEQFFSQAKWGRDPFRLEIVSMSGGKRSMSFDGVLLDGTKPTAIFGERFVNVGDAIQKYEVTAISKDAVYMTDGQTVYELKLGESLEDLP